MAEGTASGTLQIYGGSQRGEAHATRNREDSLGRGQRKVVLEDELSSGGRSNLQGWVHEWARVSQEPDKLG